MSDYLLDILSIQRALVPTVKPRLPALFEPPSPRLTVGELEETVMTEAPRSPSVHSEEKQVRAEPEPYRGVLRVLPLPPEQRTRPQPPTTAPVDAPPRTSVTPPDYGEPQTAPLTQKGPNERQAMPVETARRAPENPLPHPAAVIRVNAVPLPALAPRIKPVSPLPNDAETPPPSAPTVHVHIGRITVKAVPPPAPKPRREPPASKKMSLDEYLQARERGAR